MHKNKTVNWFIFVVIFLIFTMVSNSNVLAQSSTTTPTGPTTTTPTGPTTTVPEGPTTTVPEGPSTSTSLSNEDCSSKGARQYMPSGSCGTRERTCCGKKKWSNWDKVCSEADNCDPDKYWDGSKCGCAPFTCSPGAHADYDRCECTYPACVGMQSWSENLGRCACAEEPGFHSGPITATVSNNKKLNENCVWVCDRTDCHAGYQFNNETCKCHKATNMYSVKDSIYISGKVEFLCDYRNHWATFQCNSLIGGRVGNVRYNNDPGGYYTGYPKCPENLTDCSIGSRCREENDPCKKNPQGGGDTPTTSTGSGSNLEKCGISFTCPSEAQCISGTGVIFERSFSGSVNFRECKAELDYYGIFPWEMPSTTPATPSGW